MNTNLTCSLEEQECEESVDENEGLDLDEEVQQPLYGIGSGRRPWQGFPDITRPVKSHSKKAFLKLILLLKSSFILKLIITELYV